MQRVERERYVAPGLSQHDHTKESMRIFVANLDWGTTEDALEELFAPYGRAVLCCGPLQRAAAACRGRVQREAQAVVTGEHEGRATGGRRENAVYSTYPSFILPIRSVPPSKGI